MNRYSSDKGWRGGEDLFVWFEMDVLGFTLRVEYSDGIFLGKKISAGQ